MKGHEDTRGQKSQVVWNFREKHSFQKRWESFRVIVFRLCHKRVFQTLCTKYVHACAPEVFARVGTHCACPPGARSPFPCHANELIVANYDYSLESNSAVISYTESSKSWRHLADFHLRVIDRSSGIFFMGSYEFHAENTQKNHHAMEKKWRKVQSHLSFHSVTIIFQFLFCLCFFFWVYFDFSWNPMNTFLCIGEFHWVRTRSEYIALPSLSFTQTINSAVFRWRSVFIHFSLGRTVNEISSHWRPRRSHARETISIHMMYFNNEAPWAMQIPPYFPRQLFVYMLIFFFSERQRTLDRAALFSLFCTAAGKRGGNIFCLRFMNDRNEIFNWNSFFSIIFFELWINSMEFNFLFDSHQIIINDLIN